MKITYLIALISVQFISQSAFAWSSAKKLAITPPEDCRVAYTFSSVLDSGAINERGMNGMSKDDDQLKKRSKKIIEKFLKKQGYIVDNFAKNTFEFHIERASLFDPSSGEFFTPRGIADVSYYNCGLELFPTYASTNYLVDSNHGDIGPEYSITATGALRALILNTIPECNSQR